MTGAYPLDEVSERRSAIIVAFRLPPGIERIRQRHVPNAALGVPPHVTILSPFMPAERLDATVRAQLASIVARRPAFDVRFEHWASFPDALYLQPEPARPLAELIVAIASAFPEHPPYGEPTFRPEDAVPHLTIAIGEPAALDRLVPAAAAGLPVEGRATRVTVMAEGVDSRWRTRWRLALRR
jgi:2'-5' RNA ligase